MNPARLAVVNAVYDKLDVNGNNLVRVDTVAKHFNPDRHPDVVNSQMTPKKAYMQFMQM